MRKLLGSKLFLHVFTFALLAGAFALFAGSALAQTSDDVVEVNQGMLGFRIPNLADILTFVIRVFFVIAGLAALLFLLLGAFGWVTSGGEKDAITAARDKIQAAVVGLIMIVAVLAIIVTLEQIVFNERICLGISCPVKVPSLVTNCVPKPGSDTECCADTEEVAMTSNTDTTLICCQNNNGDGVCE